MSRVYLTKPDRKTEYLTLPISREAKDKLEKKAHEEGRTKTDVARRILMNGLGE